MKRTSRSTILTGRMTASKPTKTGTTLLAAAPQSAKEPAIVCVIAYQKRAGIGGAGCQFTSSHPDQVWSNLFLAEGCVRPPRCHDAGECVARFQLHHVCVSRLDDQWGMRNSSLPRRVGTLLPLSRRVLAPHHRYGQTGAGKSYSFVGYGSNKGILPQAPYRASSTDSVDQTHTTTARWRAADLPPSPRQRSATLSAAGVRGDLQADQGADRAQPQVPSALLPNGSLDSTTVAPTRESPIQVECAMMEIYGRELRDLLHPKSKEKLKIRNGKTGTYVQGLKKSAVGSYEAIEKVQDVGTANRTVGVMSTPFLPPPTVPK